MAGESTPIDPPDAHLRPIRIAPSIIRMGLGLRLSAAAALAAVLIGLTLLVIR